jgi:hypothetical protein
MKIGHGLFSCLIIFLFFIPIGCKYTDRFYEIQWAPILQAPENEAIFKEPMVILEWEHEKIGSETNGYEVLIDNQLIDTIRAQDKDSTYSYSLPSELISPQDAPYTWTVVAYNDFERLPAKTSRNFYVEPLEPPSLTCQDQTFYCAAPHSFTWSPVDSVSSYDIALATSSDFSDAFEDTIETTSFTETLEPNTTYYFRVRSIVTSMASDWVTCTIEIIQGNNLLNATPACMNTDPSITFMMGTGQNVENLKLDGNPVTVSGDSATYTAGGLSGGEIYTWTWEYNNGDCIGSFDTTTTIYDLPTTNLNQASDVCTGDDPEITFNAGMDGTIENLTFDGNPVSISGFSTSYSGVGLSAGSSYAWEWDFTNINGCTDHFSESIEVYDLPSSNLIDAHDVCSSENPTISFTSGTGASITNLTFDGTPVTPSGDSATYTGGLAGGSFDWAWDYTDANGCADSFSTSITVTETIPPTLDAIGSFCSNESVVLSWSDEGAISYDVEWGTDTTYGVGSDNSTTNSLDINTLGAGMYYYRVRQDDGTCTSFWSSTTNHSFIVNASPSSPGSGTLSVNNDGCTEGCTVGFIYDDSGGYVYDIEYVLTSGSFTNTPTIDDSPGSPENEVMSSSGTYQWQIRAEDTSSGCLGSWVSGPDFTIVPGGGPPSPPGPISIDSGDCDMSCSTGPILSWSTVPGATYYVVGWRCGSFPACSHEDNIGNVTTINMENTDIVNEGICNCAGLGFFKEAWIKACNASGCSSGTDTGLVGCLCGGGVCC